MAVDITVDSPAPAGEGAMSAIGGFLGGPVGAAIGSIGSGLFDRRSARKERQHREAREDSAYQRAAADMEKAGLNRILALGSPAASAASASASMPDIGSAGVGGAEQERKRKAQPAELRLMEEQIGNVAAQTQASSAQAAQSRTQAQLNTSTKQAVDYENERRKVEAKIFDDLGPAGFGLKMLIESLGGGSGKAISDLLKGGKSK